MSAAWVMLPLEYIFAVPTVDVHVIAPFKVTLEGGVVPPIVRLYGAGVLIAGRLNAPGVPVESIVTLPFEAVIEPLE